MPEKYHIETKPVPPRRPRIGKFGVVDWREDCARCHNCVKKACVYDRYRQEADYLRTLENVDALFFECMGCFSCVPNCTKGLLRLVVNPVYEALGNEYWTPEIIHTTWAQAEPAKIPVSGAGYRGPFSGPGFDGMWTDMSEIVRPTRDGIHGREYISTSVDIGRKPAYLTFADKSFRIDASCLSIPMPLILNLTSPRHTLPRLGPALREAAVRTGILALAKAIICGTDLVSIDLPLLIGLECHLCDHCEPGMPCPARLEEVPFDYAADRMVNLIAAWHDQLIEVMGAMGMREAVLGISLFSPFPFHSVYSIEDHMKHLDWIKHINKRALVSTKVSTPTDVDMVAVGSYAAGTHIIHIDGGYGGTGASPDIAKKNIAMPIEYAIGKVHGFLKAEGVRDKVTLMASGGVRTAHDAAKAIALGADGVIVGTAELVALGCVRCTRCESGRGCPRGIATTDPELSGKMDIAWGTQRIINLYNAWRSELVEILWRFGMRSVSELRGRTDLLMHLDYTNEVRQ